MSSDIEAIKTRLNSATPGPWYLKANDLIGGWCVRTVDTPPSEGGGEVADFAREEDARLIAHARQDIESLLAEVEYLRVERAAVVAWLRAQSQLALYDDKPDAIADRIERGEHRREDGKPCLVLVPVDLDEAADLIEQGKHRIGSSDREP